MNTPKGWTECRLGSVVELQVGYPFKSTEYAKAGVRLLRGDNIAPGALRWEDAKFWPSHLLGDVQQYQVQQGDIILAMDRPVISSGLKLAIATDNDVPCLLVQRVARIRTSALSSRYLKYAIERPDFIHHISGRQTGSLVPHISGGTIAQYPIPIAPLNEQWRIVAEIEKQFARLDDAVATLERVKANLQQARASVLKAAVEGRLVPTEAELARAEGRDFEPASVLLERILDERRAQWPISKPYQTPSSPDIESLPDAPEGWTWTTVDQAAAPVPRALCDGPFGSNLKTEHYTHEGPRVIRLQNIGDAEFRDIQAHISQAHFETLRKHEVLGGELVIASLGEALPRSCIVPHCVGPAIVKADCIRFMPNDNLVDRRYINFALNSPMVQKRTTEFLHGVGRPRLGLGGIREIAIPLPPLTEQHRIVAEVERRLTILDSIAATVDRRLASCTHLRQSILKRAFEGKLVPQDPTDEPASELLARIAKPAKPRSAK